MHCNYLIIGGGICGTWLSYYLLKNNASVIVIDDGNAASASNVASGLINPVTGRRVVTTWMADELLPFAKQEYTAFGLLVNEVLIEEKSMLAFPSAPDLYEAFIKRMQQQNSYISASPVSKKQLAESFFFPFDVMQISPCYSINVRNMLAAWKHHLQQNNCILNEAFDESALELLTHKIQYKNIQADKIIHCNGINASQSKYWKNLPFAQNKGEALIADIPALNTEYMYKFGNISLIPWQDNLWWIGSSNEWNFSTKEPTKNFRDQTVAALKQILKTGFTIKEHVAAVRPAALERRPFAGLHPTHQQIGILNGMGSKGCSLAPWFAKQLSELLISKKPIDTIADVQRFAKILQRN